MTTVDAHHHFWDPRRSVYPWMTPDLDAIRLPFGPDDLRPLLDAAGIDRSILVQTRGLAVETEEFLATAAATPFVAGVIGWVDLTAPDVADAIARLRSLHGGAKLVAIRHQVHDEPDAEWLDRPDVHRGIAAVEAAGLPYDLLIRPREMPAALRTVAAFPGLRFIVDHIAKPPIADAAMEPWATGIRALAASDNVTCKLSGMVTEADWATWKAADLAPFVDVVLEAFGPDRLMYGSDWPVCLLAAPYDRVVATARELTAELTRSERDRVFGGTATEVYSLPE
ncbi:MAG: amidohydrolase family protein [Chloroflexota bacterium]